MSALSLLARDENKFVKLGEHDTVILSSHAIPGNESNVNKVIDGLLRRGAEVVHSGIADVHATGHAQADEIKTYLSLVRPEFYVPIHGEFRHMVANARLGMMMGIPHDRVVLCEDGDVIELSDDGLTHVGRVPAGYVYVDGIVGDVSYDGQGCSISQAATSVLTDQVIGLPVEQALATVDSFAEMVGSRGTVEGDEDVIGDGIAFAGVAKYPARVKCALLGWMAFKDAVVQIVDGAPVPSGGQN